MVEHVFVDVKYILKLVIYCYLTFTRAPSVNSFNSRTEELRVREEE